MVFNTTALGNGRYLVGTLASFFCNSGYSLKQKAKSIICQANGLWKTPPETCDPGNKVAEMY